MDSNTKLSVRDQLEVLKKEYELAVNRYDTTDNRHVQLVVALVAVLGIIGTYVTQTLKPSVQGYPLAGIPALIAFLAPLLFIMLYAFFIYVMYTARSHSLICNILTLRINRLLHDTALIRFEPGLPPTIYFQPVGPKATKVRLIYYLLFAISFAFFAAVIWSACAYIYETVSHFGAVVFVLVYLAAGLFEVFAFVGVVYDLPSWYRRLESDLTKAELDDKYNFADKNLPREIKSRPNSSMQGRVVPATNSVPLQGTPRRIRHIQTNAWRIGYGNRVVAAINMRSIFACVLPRRRDFITRGMVFWFGFIAALIFVQWHEDQVARAYNLLGPAWSPQVLAAPLQTVGPQVASTPLATPTLQPTATATFQSSANTWLTGADVPFWAWPALALAYFVIEELLLQQSKYLWDYVRGDDCYKDSLSPNNSRLSVNDIPRKIAQTVLIVRVVLAFTLGAWLGGWSLFLLLAIIAMHHALYVLVIRSSGPPLLPFRLIFRSLSLPLRFAAGTLVVVPAPWLYPILCLLALLFFFYSLGGAAAHWTMDARHRKAIRRRSSKLFARNHNTLKPSANCLCDSRDQMMQQRKSLNSQDTFFRKYGFLWRWAGLALAVCTGIVLVTLELLALSDLWGLRREIDWYIKYDPTLHRREYLNADVWPWALGALAALLAGTLIVCRTRKDIRVEEKEATSSKGSNLGLHSMQLDNSAVGREQSPSPLTAKNEKRKQTKSKPKVYWGTLSWFTGGFLLVILAVCCRDWHPVYFDSAIALLGGIVAINVGRLLRYIGMTYKEYNHFKSDGQVARARRAWGDYLFRPKNGRRLKEAASETAALFW